jgi:tryptophanyl-tRNA synthetase
VRGKAAPKEALKEIAKRTAGKLYEEHVDIFKGALVEVESAVREVELKYGGYSFIPPASTYHKFMTGLQGGKMSSSIPESYIALTDKPEEGVKVIRQRPGKETLEEQRVRWRIANGVRIAGFILSKMICRRSIKTILGGTRVAELHSQHS